MSWRLCISSEYLPRFGRHTDCPVNQEGKSSGYLASVTLLPYVRIGEGGNPQYWQIYQLDCQAPAQLPTPDTVHFEGFSPRRQGYDLGHAIKMEVVNLDDGRYELRENLPRSSNDSEVSSSFDRDLTEDKDSEDEEDLKEDLQKTIPQCYKSDSNFTSQTSTSSDYANDDEFQATALCQFMDILNDLDAVLDKSLLACLDDPIKNFDSDEEDLICKIKECINEPHVDSEQSSIDDDVQVICATVQHTTPSTEEAATPNIPHRVQLATLGRSKSFSDLSGTRREVFSVPLERAGTTNDNLRNSMRRLDPIVLPEIASEPLTLPVILFLEHHVNLRPTSAPIQVQVTAANLTSDGSSGPLIVGRRTLLMNRALSLPSPVESANTDEYLNRYTARSMSLSSSSSESLNAMPVPSQPSPGAIDERADETEEPPFGVWPHSMSAMLACLSCTVGLFNISRFALFSVDFGASFIVQFLILSLLIGIPLFTLHLCLGQVLESGPMDMWRISPIFQGVGISLLITQAALGIYSIIGLSWVFVFFRDSFISAGDKYKWALPHEFNFEVSDAFIKNTTFKIEETLPQYIYGEMLQKSPGQNGNVYGSIKFQVAFNLAVVWMIIFVALSKGLRSYGKAVYLLVFLPICGTLILCTKLLTLIPYDAVTNIFSDTDWGEFFINSNSWAAAAQETFLTWGLLGPCVMQLISHKTMKNRTSKILQRECACIVGFTITILLLASFLANACVQILKGAGYAYIPGSFETLKSSQFLWPTSQPMPGTVSLPVRYTTHYGNLVGVSRAGAGATGGPGAGAGARVLSGWTPLHLLTQLVPAALAVLPSDSLSPIWAVLFYWIVISLGLAQQAGVWHCVVAGVSALNQRALRCWETSVTFLSCALGLAAGLCLTTDAGVGAAHFLDYVLAGAWWHCVLQTALAAGVFVVRGRPYCPETVAACLLPRGGAVLGFTWTVALPVLLCTISVMDFRVGQQRQLYTWRKPTGYWPIWCRQVAVAIQQGILLTIPATAFIQTWRYISKGPPDILDRIQNLYRPRMGSTAGTLPTVRPAPAPRAPAPDPPPKYTPPPSYSTATGARWLRRSLRARFSTRAAPATSNTSQIPITLSETVENAQTESQPPQYSGIITPTITVTNETNTQPHSSTSRRSLTLTRDYLRRSFVRKSDSVKSIRSSLRRSFKYGGLTTSNEHLVRDIEPISNTVAMLDMIDTETNHTRSLASVI